MVKIKLVLNNFNEGYKKKWSEKLKSLRMVIKWN